MFERREFLRAGLLGGASLGILGAAAGSASAQAIEQLQMFIPAAPGGGWDQTGRSLEQAMKARQRPSCRGKPSTRSTSSTARVWPMTANHLRRTVVCSRSRLSQISVGTRSPPSGGRGITCAIVSSSFGYATV